MNTVIRKIGNSEGVIIPKEILDEMQLTSGDEVEFVRGPEGLMLVRKDTEFRKQMASAREAMHKYRDALRELAK